MGPTSSWGWHFDHRSWSNSAQNQRRCLSLLATCMYHQFFNSSVIRFSNACQSAYWDSRPWSSTSQIAVLSFQASMAPPRHAKTFKSFSDSCPRADAGSKIYWTCGFCWSSGQLWRLMVTNMSSFSSCNLFDWGRQDQICCESWSNFGSSMKTTRWACETSSPSGAKTNRSAQSATGSNFRSLTL